MARKAVSPTSIPIEQFHVHLLMVQHFDPYCLAFQIQME